MNSKSYSYQSYQYVGNDYSLPSTGLLDNIILFLYNIIDILPDFKNVIIEKKEYYNELETIVYI